MVLLLSNVYYITGFHTFFSAKLDLGILKFVLCVVCFTFV